MAATGVLTLGLVAGGTTAVQASVTAKDLPSRANIVNVYSKLQGGHFETVTSKQVFLPAKRCADLRTVEVSSSRAIAGSRGSLSVTSEVTQFKSKAAAKSAMASYRRLIRRCASYTGDSGATVTITRNRAPRLGQDRLAMSSATNWSGRKVFASVVIIRKGRRLADVSAVDEVKPSKRKVRRLAKVAARKMG